MKVLLWHGWLLEGSGSNVYAARVTEVLRRNGHDVALVCQEGHPERYRFLDAWAGVGPEGVGPLQPLDAEPGGGRAILLRPQIGRLLPVFVYDEYEGFEVKRFVDLSASELDGYLEANVRALRAAAAWHGSELVVAGHAVPGPVIARRAIGPDRYVAKVHGSDLEYAIREQERYADLAREGLEGARAVAGPSRDALDRTVSFVPAVADRVLVIPPGVEVEDFRPEPRRPALEDTAAALDRDPDTTRGRPEALDEEVKAAVRRRDQAALDDLAFRYDQTVPDREVAKKVRALAEWEGPLAGYLGKFILQKGVDRLVEAVALVSPRPKTVVVGFGTFREWLAALSVSLDAGDAESVAWLQEAGGIPVELSGAEMAGARELLADLTFTGRLDHRYAPGVLAALDVLVVPSVLKESFGMVAAEGAAAGALPLVAGHSGLAEVAAALEDEVGRRGLFSYEPGAGATRRLAAGLERLLNLPPPERAELRRAVSAFVAREWTWGRTAERLLAAGA
jgi:glycosyltransferase involved in cell wall biosynthesis